MNPLRARYSKIERVVENLLDEFRVYSPHVPIEKIVKGSGIKLKAGKLGDVSGLLARTATETTIGVNVEHPKVRQRFTVAHEFGHYILHAGIVSHFDKEYRVNFRSAESAQATNIEEIEANFFAASILMPRKFLERDNAIEALDSDVRVQSLAARYRVSRHAMSLRLANVYRLQRPF